MSGCFCSGKCRELGYCPNHNPLGAASGMGWICPQCRRVYSPDVKECMGCSDHAIAAKPWLDEGDFNQIWVNKYDCKCKENTVCHNAACPRSPKVTC